VVLLGNHDLHLLAAAAGVRAPHAGDTLDAILAAPDRDALIDWVRRRPLAHVEAGALFVHAGVPPQWTIAQTVALAGEVQQRLSGPDHTAFLAHMYGNQPARWDDALGGDDRLRCIVNGLTRIRVVTPDGRMDFATKESVTAAPPGLLAWFDHPERASQPSRGGLPVVFGHWSALGLMLRSDAIGLDTGCVWGGALTALSWPSRAIHQVACPQYRRPGP
jgi:bis(5'-nucleosyl)-tetraphosphatase (symmetrical)